MLLDELLIKIGVDADSQTLTAFGQALDNLGQNSAEFAVRFGQLITEMEALEQSAQSMSDADLLNAWQEKAEAFNALMQEYAGVFDETTEATDSLTQQTVSLGEGINQTSEAVSQATQTADQASAAIAKQTESTKQNSEANKENEQSLDEMTASVGQFILTSLGLDQAVSKFDQLKGSIDSLPKALGVLGASLGAGIAGLTFFVDKTLTALDGIYQLSNVTGEATDYIYQLGKVAETSGSSVQAAEASIVGLSKAIGEAASGKGRGAQAFELYGLKAKKANGEIKQTSEVLEEIREKMKGLSEQEQIAMLSKLGIDGTMIQVLRKDAAEFQAELAQNKAMTLGVGTAEDAQNAAAFKDALADFFKMTKAMAEVIALRLAPAITHLLNKFKDWFIINNQLIKNGLSVLGNILAGIIDGITGFLDAVDYIITGTIGWENAFYALGAAIMWLVRGPLTKFTMALMTNPFTWLIVGIAAFILLLDDLMTHLDGGNSLFGEYWEPLAEGLREIQALFKQFEPEIEWIKGVFKRFVGALSGNWDNFVKHISRAFKGVFQYLGNLIKLIVGLFTGDTQKMSEAISGIWQGLKDTISGIWSAAFSQLTAIWQEFVGDKLDLSVIEKGFKQVTDWIKKPFQLAFDWVKSLYDSTIGPIIDAVSNFSVSGMVDSAGDAIKDGWDSTKNAVGDFFGSVGNFFTGNNNPVQAVSSAPNIAKAGITKNHQTNQQTDNRKFNYQVTQHIQGSTDPKQTADLSARAIQNVASTTVQ